MKTFPAIALIELSNIADGMQTADRMLKQSPISLLKAGTLSGGKYLIMVGGSVAATEEAYKEGIVIAGDAVVDRLILPDVHTDLFAAIAGKTAAPKDESLLTIETHSIASIIAAADAALKSTQISLVDLRMADAYGGKAYVIYNGKIEDIEDAREISLSLLSAKDVSAKCSLIARIADDLATQLHGSQRFSESDFIHPEDGETDVIG